MYKNLKFQYRYLLDTKLDLSPFARPPTNYIKKTISVNFQVNNFITINRAKA